MRRVFVSLAGFILLQLTTVFPGTAQTNSSKQSNLISDTAGLAPNQDANLLNPWGICFLPGLPFWISDNKSGLVSLTCSGQPLGSTCSFVQSSVTPASGAMTTTTMNIVTNSNPYMAAALLRSSSSRLPGPLLTVMALGIFCLFLLRALPRGRPSAIALLRYAGASLAVAMLAAALLTAGGCGYDSSSATGTQRGTATIMISGTSGSLSHSTSVSLTVQ